MHKYFLNALVVSNIAVCEIRVCVLQKFKISSYTIYVFSNELLKTSTQKHNHRLKLSYVIRACLAGYE